MKMQSQRQAYGETLLKLGEENKNIAVLDADLGKSTMSWDFSQKYPERSFEMGIAEANMVSFAAGLALTGKIPFVNTFAVFASGRPYDQIRQSVSIGSLNVKVVGSSSGLSDFGDGATHQAIEDMAIMRAIPNMTVFSPCDANETRKVVEFMAGYDGPCYMRTNRNPVPDVLPENEQFEFNMPKVVKDGSDAVVFATGIMVSRALEAAEKLAGEGVSVKVVNIATIKPFNDDKVRELASGAKGVVCAEEHSYIGGLTSAVAYALKSEGLPFGTVAVEDVFGQSAEDYDLLLSHYKLTAQDIEAKIQEVIK